MPTPNTIQQSTILPSRTTTTLPCFNLGATLLLPRANIQALSYTLQYAITPNPAPRCPAPSLWPQTGPFDRCDGIGDAVDTMITAIATGRAVAKLQEDRTTGDGDGCWLGRDARHGGGHAG